MVEACRFVCKLRLGFAGAVLAVVLCILLLCFVLRISPLCCAVPCIVFSGASVRFAQALVVWHRLSNVLQTVSFFAFVLLTVLANEALVSTPVRPLAGSASRPSVVAPRKIVVSHAAAEEISNIEDVRFD